MQKGISIHSEAEHGQGYTDMLVIPREEFGKVARRKEALAEKIQEALDQIEDKAYIT